MSKTTFRVVLHRAVPGEIERLPKGTREQVKEAISQLAHDPRPARASKLKGHPCAYRLRFGNYRLLYEVHATEVVVYVIGVAHRKEVYKRLLKRR